MKYRYLLLCAAALAVATTAAYSNHFHNAFHFDDFHTIANNRYIRDVENIPLFFRDGTTFSSLPANQTYRPLVSASLALDWMAAEATGSGETFFFHLSAFSLFLIQGLGMFFLYRKIFALSGEKELAEPAALLGVALYLLHPANAETVNYIIARSDSLSTLAIVLGLVLFACSPFCRRHHLFLVPVAAGTLAKPLAAIFVPLLFLYLVMAQEGAAGEAREKAKWQMLRTAARGTAPSLLLAAALLVFIHRMQPATWSPGSPPLYDYLITQPFVALHYFGTFFLPVGLSADTDLRPFRTLLDLRSVAGLSFVVILAAVAVVLSGKEKLRPVSFGLFWFLITLLPTSLFPLAEVMNDHRTFLPYVGLALAVAWTVALSVRWVLARHPVWRSAAAVALMGLLCAAGWGTHRRNEVWRSEETLWRDVTEKSPGNGRGHMNYGLALMARGDFAAAEISFRKALALTPKYSPVHVNMGIVKGATGKDREAETWFKSAISCNPRSPDGYFFYGRFLESRHREDEAIRMLGRAVDLSPAHLEAGRLLAELRGKGMREKRTENGGNGRRTGGDE